MIELESFDYITQPHTTAGQMPGAPHRTPSAGQIVGKCLHNSLYDVFADYISVDAMSIDAEAAAEPALAQIAQIRELGYDEAYGRLVSALALHHALNDELPGPYVLPEGGDFLCQN